MEDVARFLMDELCVVSLFLSYLWFDLCAPYLFPNIESDLLRVFVVGKVQNVQQKYKKAKN